MAYKYQPIKDEMFGEEEDDANQNGDAEEEEDIAGKVENGDIEVNGVAVTEGAEEPESILGSVDEEELKKVANLPPNSKVKQVIEQDGVLILETVEADPNDPDLPVGTTILADGDETLGNSTMNSTMDSTMNTTDDSSMNDSAILAELQEVNNIEMKPAVAGGKKVELDKDNVLDEGEKVECQLCNQTFAVGMLRWHILKEHCHNKVKTNKNNKNIALF